MKIRKFQPQQLDLLQSVSDNMQWEKLSEIEHGAVKELLSQLLLSIIYVTPSEIRERHHAIKD